MTKSAWKVVPLPRDVRVRSAQEPNIHMQGQGSPSGGERPPYPATHASGRCFINVLGPNRLLNELLASFLLAETTGLCRRNRNRSDSRDTRQECLRIDFIDSREAGFPGRWMKDAESLPPCSHRRVVVFFNVPENASEDTVSVALAHGARGIFYRNDSRSTIAKGIQSILAGDVWFQRESLYRVAAASTVLQESSPRTPESSVCLTGREREILARLATGACNQEIADSLHVSLHTVKTHLYRIFRKINVRSRQQAMLWGISHPAVAAAPPVFPRSSTGADGGESAARNKALQAQ